MNNTTLGIVGVVAVAVGVVGTLALSDLLTPKYGIVIHATAQDISDDKWSKILEKMKLPSKTPHADPRDKLYRVADFKDGKEIDGSEKGSLPDVELLDDRQVPANFSGHAFQIGIGAIERSKTIPNGSDMPQGHFRQNLLESKEMVKDVNNVLDE